MPLRDLSPLLMLAMLALGSFVPVLLQGGFVSDDFPWIAYARDPAMQKDNFLLARTFRPAMAFSLQTDWRLWQLESRGFLATNVILHVLVGATVYRLGRAGHPQVSRGSALLGSALFVVHPRHSEAVAWVSGRADILCSLPYLWGLLAFLCSHERRAPWLRLVALGCFALALLGKETAVTFPLVVTLLTLRVRVIPGQALLRGARLRSIVPFWVLLVVYMGYRRMVLGEWVGIYGASVHLNADPQLLAENLARFLVAMVWPANFPLAPFRVFLMNHPVLLLTLGLAAGGSVVLLRRAIPWSEVKPGIVWFFLTTVPALPLRVSLADVRGERLLYLPSVGACLAAGILLFQVTAATHSRLAPVIRGLPVLLLALLTFMLSVDWVESGALARRFTSDLRAQTAGLSCDSDVYILTVPGFLGRTVVLYNQRDIDGVQTLYGDPCYLRRVRGMIFQELAFSEELLLEMRSDTSELSVRVPLHASTRINFESVAHLGVDPLPDANRRWDWVFQVPRSLPRDTLFAFTAGRVVRVW